MNAIRGLCKARGAVVQRVPIIVGIHDRNVGGRLAPAGRHDDWQSGVDAAAAASDSDLEGAGRGCSGGAGAAGAPPGPGGNSGGYPTISLFIHMDILKLSWSSRTPG